MIIILEYFYCEIGLLHWCFYCPTPLIIVVLDRFSGDGNPEDWIYRAERYFTYVGFSEEHWLPLLSLYLDGEALEWFRWMFRNNQFFDWNHFKEKLSLRFRKDSNMNNHNVNALSMMRKLDENFSTKLCKLDNVGCALSVYSQSVVEDPMRLDMDTSYDDEKDSALSFDESSHAFDDLVASDSDTSDECFDDLVASDSDTGDECIQPSLQADVVQTNMQVLSSDLLCDLNDGTLDEVNSETLEEVLEVSAYKVFAEMPNRDIDMAVADSVKNDLVKLENHVFAERFHSNGICATISPNVELATPLIENEPTISIWDPGINSEFTPVIGSTTKVKISKFTMSIMFLCEIFGVSTKGCTKAEHMDVIEFLLFCVQYFEEGCVSPNNDSAWSMILQVYSSSSSVTLWGKQVCGLDQKHLAIDVSEHFSRSLAIFLALNHVTLVQHIWMEQCNALLEHIDPDGLNIINLKKARKWKGLEHHLLVHLMSLFTITYSRGHLGTRCYGGNEYIGIFERPYQSPYYYARLCKVCTRWVAAARSIQDHILYFATIPQFVLATTGGQHASTIVLDLNLEDKVLIEDGSIVMN